MSDISLEKYIMPWKIRNGGDHIDYHLCDIADNTIIVLWQLASYSDRYAISYMHSSIKVLHYIYKSNSEKLIDHMNSIRTFLIENGYEFLDEDRVNKLKLLL